MRTEILEQIGLSKNEIKLYFIYKKFFEEIWETARY
jgi:hypothetical protein